MKTFLKDPEIKSIHNKALKSGILYINEAITDKSIYTIYHKLLVMINERLEGSTLPQIQVIINSQGGDASVGLAIANFIANSPVPIRTQVLGEAASAAALIFLGGAVREISSGSRIVVHYSSISGISTENSKQTRLSAKYHSEIDQEIETFIAARTKLEIEIVRQNLNEGDWFLNSVNAAKFGFSNF